jgi:hypothetical protein
VIVCEGTQTEPAYLKSVRGLFCFGPNVAVVGTGDDPLSVVRLAAALRDDISMRAKRGLGALRVFDEAWAAFDVESDPARVGRLREAIALAEALAVKVAVCNPCFEYWLLLHLTEHTAAIESPTAAQALLAGRLGTYAKGAPPVPTIATIGDAAARARTTRQRHLGCEGDGNPSTNWDHLMKALAEAGDPGVRARLPQFDTYDESLLRPLCGLARSSPRRGGPKRG